MSRSGKKGGGSRAREAASTPLKQSSQETPEAPRKDVMQLKAVFFRDKIPQPGSMEPDQRFMACSSTLQIAVEGTRQVIISKVAEQTEMVVVPMSNVAGLMYDPQS